MIQVLSSFRLRMVTDFEKFGGGASQRWNRLSVSLSEGARRRYTDTHRGAAYGLDLPLSL